MESIRNWLSYVFTELIIPELTNNKNSMLNQAKLNCYQHFLFSRVTNSWVETPRDMVKADTFDTIFNSKLKSLLKIQLFVCLFIFFLYK